MDKPVKMYGIMWEDAKRLIETMKLNLSMQVVCDDILKEMAILEDRHTYISSPDAIRTLKISKKTLARFRDAGMEFAEKDGCFFYREEDIRGFRSLTPSQVEWRIRAVSATGGV